jgi:hypothetical protein
MSTHDPVGSPIDPPAAHPAADAAPTTHADAPAPLDRRILLGVAGLAGVAALSRVGRAGPINPPPGPVAPSGPSLSDVNQQVALLRDDVSTKLSSKVARTPSGFAEPRIPLTACLSSQEAQFVIAQPGAYYLPSNIARDPSKPFCVLITCDDVDLDGGGFAFVGASSPVASSCIRADSRTNLEIYDCSFVSCSGPCVDCATCDSVFVSDCCFRDCATAATSIGIVHARDGCQIEDCTFISCSGCCVIFRDQGSFLGLTTRTNFAVLLQGRDQCDADDCSVSNLSLPGVTDACYSLRNECTISECSAFGVDGLAFSLGSACTMDECEIVRGSGPAITAGEGSSLCGTTTHFRTAPGTMVSCQPSCSISECEMRKCTCPIGYSVGSSSVIECCEITNGAGDAIACADACSVEDCTIMYMQGVAIRAGSRCSIEDNHALQCWGIECASECCITDNEVSSSGGGGSGGAISILGERCCVSGNFVSSGGIALLPGANGCLIEDNHAVGAGGAAGTGGGSISIAQGVTGCTVRNNHSRNNSVSSAMHIPQGNSFGPVVNATSGGDLSALPNGAHPHANFVY